MACKAHHAAQVPAYLPRRLLQVTYNCFHQRLFQKCSETYM